MNAFEDIVRAGGDRAVKLSTEFFMQSDPVHESLRRISTELGDRGIPYAVVGGMALVAHGYKRNTEDVDILVSASDLRTLHEALDGRGYLPPFTGSRQLRDTRTGVKIEFLIAGQYPGDGAPKPVAFPDPAAVAVQIDGISYVRLPTLIELKLASGMTNPGRLRDLADVQELIRVLKLPAAYGRQLDPYVQDRFRDLHAGVAADRHGEP